MKEFQTDEIRNIAFLGHAGTGKTTIVEAILHYTGATSKMGKIDEGNTKSDYTDIEKEKKHSLNSTVLVAEHKKYKINIFDTPGYLDFVNDSKSITRVADMGMIIVHAEHGCEVGTDLVYKFVEEDNLPLGFIVNHIDRDKSDFDKVVEELQETYGNGAVPFVIPVTQHASFSKVADVITQKIYTFSLDGKGTMDSEELTGDIKDKVESIREKLMESVAESDEALLEKFFEEGSLSDEELMTGINKAIATRQLFPIFPLSATTNVGTGTFLEAATSYFPAPDQRGAIMGLKGGEKVEMKISDNDKLSLFVFKTNAESHAGELSIFKVMTGKLLPGVDLNNQNSGKSEKISQIFIPNGKEKFEVAHLHAGDIGTVAKLKSTRTNDTLTEKGFDIKYPAIQYPLPVIREAVLPKSRADEDKLKEGLQTLMDIDPTFSYEIDPELKQTVISGQGTLHLQVMLEKLKARFNVEVNLIQPKVGFRETITKPGEGKYRHKKQSGGAGQFAEVWMRVRPGEPGSGVVFRDTLVGQNVDRVFVPSVEKGVKQICEEGIVAGYKVTDIEVDFYDGKMHPVDSKDIAFQIAGRGALKECFAVAKPVLLEPIYNLEVTIPEEYMGDVMGDISTRRGKVSGMDSSGKYQIIKAQVPLSELYHYGTTLRSMTQGKGLFAQKFSHYDRVPGDVQEKIVAESQKEKEE
ncbi:MAG: elongation factor G [Candidatus Marinimicrobia bacterium]|nr:elongation factor G [Candidatus Neomarinimicrobiota bacterium]